MRKTYKALSALLCIILVFFSGCRNKSEEIYQNYISDSENISQNAGTPTADPENVPQNTDTPAAEVTGTGGEDGIDDISGELRIYGGSEYFDWIVRAFNKKYPNVKISYNYPPEGIIDPSEFSAKISVDLMSGSAGDIIAMGGMPYLRYGKNCFTNIRRI